MIPLLIDIQALQSVHHAERGIGRYVLNHLRALLRYPNLVRGLLYNPAIPLPDNLPTDIKSSPLLLPNTKEIFDRLNRDQTCAYYIMSPFEFDPVPPEFLVVPHVFETPIPILVTLYDLIPLILKDDFIGDTNFALFYEQRLHLIRQANLIFAISESTRRDAIRLLQIDPNKIISIGGGTDIVFQSKKSVQPPPKRPYFFTVLGDVPRKNLEILIRASALLPSSLRTSYQLVVGGRYSEDSVRRYQEMARQGGLDSNYLIFAQRMEDDELTRLYQNAKLFIFPSHYEGFGLPVAEAMACGCPVITSNTSSLPELLDWSPSTFDPNDAERLAALMERACCDNAFRAELINAGQRRAPLHTWEKVAERTVAGLDRLGAPKWTQKKTIPRIALVGPLPPQQTGIAEYNVRLMTPLSNSCKLDVFTSSPQHLSAPRNWNPRTRILSPLLLGHRINPYSYDTMIYCVGNSEHHVDAYHFALRYPGHIWFHDTVLISLFMNCYKDNPSLMQEKIITMYPERALKPTSQDVLNYAWYQTNELWMTQELVRAARSVFVHSEHARELLLQDQPENISLPPIHILPFGAPDLDIGDNFKNTMPLVASFGIVNRAKQPELIIDALHLLNQKQPVQLALIGFFYDQIYKKEILEYARLKGLEDKITVTDRIAESDYWNWLKQATCAVQLRAKSHGEKSAAISDCLAAGVPVVTNAVSYDDTPDDAMIKLSPSCSAQDVAVALEKIISNSNVREKYRQGSLRYAQENTFARVTDRLLQILSSD